MQSSTEYRIHIYENMTELATKPFFFFYDSRNWFRCLSERIAEFAMQHDEWREEEKWRKTNESTRKGWEKKETKWKEATI